MENLTNVSHFNNHINICFPAHKSNSHKKSNQALVLWEDLNYENIDYFKIDDIQILLMEEGTSLLWNIGSIKGLLGFELLYKDRSSMITETAGEDNIWPISHKDDTDLECSREKKK